MKSLLEGKKDEKKMTNERRHEILVEEGREEEFEAKGRERRGELGQEERTVPGMLIRRPGDAPERTQIVIIFLWTLILNLNGHLET